MASCIGIGKSMKRSTNDVNTLGKSPGGPKSIIQIYTDWANHYLEKVRSKRRIQDLQTDIIDGVALADVIEAVTNQKLADVNRKPKTPGQMLDNITACLSYVENLGVALDGIYAKDIRDGNLKSVLSLFFALSRYKQQQKQLLQQAKQAQMTHTPELAHRPMANQQQRNIPVKSSSGIPSPMTTPTKKPPDRKGGLVPPSVGISSGTSHLRAPVVHSESSSRSTSPSSAQQNAAQQQSFLPQPKSIPAPRGRLIGGSSHGANRNSQRITPVAPPTVPVNNVSRMMPGSQLPSQKGSMLDKLKLFKPPPERPKTSGSKRTSSSSGFSSARSERSDSSTSLCNDSKVNESDIREDSLTPTPDNLLSASPALSSPKNKARVPRAKIGKPTQVPKQASPKISRGKEDIAGRVSKNGSRSGSGSRERTDPSAERSSPRHDDRRTSRSRERDIIAIKDYGPLDSLPGPEAVPAPVKQSKISSLGARAEKQANRRSIPQPVAKVETMTSSGDAMTSSGSGIPKPMALVKGTTKVVSDKNQCNPVTAKPPLHRTPSLRAGEGEKGMQHSGSGSSLSIQGGVKSQLSSPCNTLPRQKSRGREDGSNVALVSPMPSSSGSSATSTSPQAPPPSSCLEKDGDGVTSQFEEISGNPKSPRASRKDGIGEVTGKKRGEPSGTQEGNLGEEAEDVLMNIKPMQPLNRNSPYGYARSLALSTRHMAPSLHTQRVAFQAEGSRNVHTFPSGFEPLRMPNGFRRQRIENDGEYAEFEGSDMPSGYVSDGDILRGPHSLPSTCRRSDASDISANGDSLDGYLSEGGASLYARRMAAMQNGRKRPEDSYDDSSSIASSISDYLNDISHRDVEPKRNQQAMLTTGMEQGPLHAGLVTPVMGRREMNGEGSRQSKRQIDPSRAVSVDRCLQAESRRVPDLTRVKAEQVRDRSESRERRRLRTEGDSQYEEAKKMERKQGARKGSREEDKGNMAYPGGSMSGESHPGSPNGESSSNSSRMGPDSRKVHAVKGVPPSFGYVKRSNSGLRSKDESKKEELKTAQVSVVPKLEQELSHSLERPRTKLKCSAGIQTTSDLNSAFSDSEYSASPYGQRIAQLKSYSLTTPCANQLSQTVRERLFSSGTQSLPKTNQTNALMMTMMMAGVNYQPTPYGVNGRDRGVRTRGLTDGSLSDTPYYGEGNNGQYSWARHSNSYATSGPESMLGGDSLDSLSSGSMMNSSKGQAGPKHQVYMNPREMSPSPRLNRSNSMRSTKSDKIYASMMQRVEDMTEAMGQEIMDPSLSSRMCYPAPSSMTSSPSSQHYGRSSFGNYGGLSSKMGMREDECHGSSLSLVSTASSLYSTQEEKQAAEIRKLRKELSDAQEKVSTLSGQLSTNAHVVSAFEQSLSNMTNRLQQITMTAEQKDNELSELRGLIEGLRKQGIDAGMVLKPLDHTVGNMPRQSSNDSMASMTSHSSASSSANAATAQVNGQTLHPLLSAEIMDLRKDGKKKSWLRSSFTKAFSRSKRTGKNGLPEDDLRGGIQSDVSAPSSPLLTHAHLRIRKEEKEKSQVKGSHSSLNLDLGESGEDLGELKKLLREKDMVLTDIRLEALTSAHQLDALKEMVNRMKSEMMSLKQDNERLQRLVSSKSLGGSTASVGANQDRRYSVPEIIFSGNSADIIFGEPVEKDSRPISVVVHFGSHGSVSRYQQEAQDLILQILDTRSLDRPSSRNPTVDMSLPSSSCSIGYVCITSQTRWEGLEEKLKRIFQEYLTEIDPMCTLGLSVDSISSYHFGEVCQRFQKPKQQPAETDSPLQQLESVIDACTGSTAHPEFLPCGYLFGDVDKIFLSLKGVEQEASLDALSFETLVPKPVLQRYLTLVREQRRVVFCGPSGTGKSYVARKLAEYLVYCEGQEVTEENIVTFSIDQKSAKEVRSYLTQLSSGCERHPTVIILDNLHAAMSMNELLSGFAGVELERMPYTIGTLSQATKGAASLQSQFNFRWIPYVNHLEPVKGFLNRYMRRKLIETELKANARLPDLRRVLDWVPRVWQHLNRFVESHSSTDVTIGPQLFLACPAHLTGSQVWFRDLWNYTLVTYLVDAVKEGLQLYGKRANWVDPAQFIYDSYPWAYGTLAGGPDGLMRIRPEDVGCDQYPSGVNLRTASITQSDNNDDPLMNMLITLQEAANYASPHSNDSDSASVNSSRQSTGSNPNIDSVS